MKKNGEKIEETKKVFFNLADSLWKSKKDILDLLEFEWYGAKSEEKLLRQVEGFLEEEIQKWKLSQELKNEILDLLKKWVGWKTWTIIDIKDKDSIRKLMEKKWLNFDELWDSYIKYLQQEREEKVKESVSSLKDIFELHKKFDGKTVTEWPKTMTVTEWLKRKKCIERSLKAGIFKWLLFFGSKLYGLFSKNGFQISNKMFREAIRTNIPIVLFDEELQKKVEDSLSVDSEFIKLVNKVKGKIEKEINELKPTNWLVYFERKSGWFIYREIDKDSDTIYCRIPIKSFWNKDLQYSIGKVDAYIKYQKGQDGIWKWSFVMDDLYDFPEWNFKGPKWILNKIWHSFQEKGKITPYHWRISFEMPDIIENDD